ncbi:hypothetical protein AB4254_11800 [Vibrio breoganii]
MTHLYEQITTLEDLLTQHKSALKSQEESIHKLEVQLAPLKLQAQRIKNRNENIKRLKEKALEDSIPKHRYIKISGNTQEECSRLIRTNQIYVIRDEQGKVFMPTFQFRFHDGVQLRFPMSDIIGNLQCNNGLFTILHFFHTRFEHLKNLTPIEYRQSEHYNEEKLLTVSRRYM